MIVLVLVSILLVGLICAGLRAPAAEPPATAGVEPVGPRLGGEALFATGLDRSTVDLDCMVPRPVAGATGESGAAEPVCLRVRHGHRPTGDALSPVVRRWAEGGERVFVELDVSRRCGLAVLRCGAEQVVVDVVNGAEAWSRLGGPTAREVAGG